MLKLVTGTKGEGKTKFMLDTCNQDGKTNDGLVIYIDKNNDHMYQLDRKIRHVNICEYPVKSVEGIIGFICGLVAGNSDIQAIYFDSFLTITKVPSEKISETLDEIIDSSEKLGIDFIISLSMDSAYIPEKYKDNILLAL